MLNIARIACILILNRVYIVINHKVVTIIQRHVHDLNGLRNHEKVFTVKEIFVSVRQNKLKGIKIIKGSKVPLCYQKELAIDNVDDD
jgi:hypothetical protein